MATRTLGAIADDLLTLEQVLIDAGGDVSDADLEATIDRWFADLGAERDQKLDSYAALVKETLARAKSRRDAAREITDLARADEGLADRLKGRLLWFFAQQDLKRVDTARARISRCANGGRLPLEVDGDPDTLPEWAQEVTVTLRFCPADLPEAADRLLSEILDICGAEDSEVDVTHVARADEAKIRHTLDAGTPLPFARYGERGEHIRVA